MDKHIDGIPQITSLVSEAFKTYLSIINLDIHVSVIWTTYIMYVRKQNEQMTVQTYGRRENFFMPGSQNLLCEFTNQNCNRILLVYTEMIY